MDEILIENEASYETAKSKRGCHQDITWVTTSPWLLVKLQMAGERVSSLERGVRRSEHEAIGWSAKEFSRSFCGRLDDMLGDKCQGYHVGRKLSMALHQLAFILLYKSMLLKRWVSANREILPDLTVVGDRDLRLPNEFAPILHRFDTIFAALAARTPSLGVKIESCPAPDGASILQKIAGKGVDRFGKRLLCLNETCSSFLLKRWLGLRERGVLPLNAVRLRVGNGPCVHMVKGCELLAEAFLPLLLRGVRFSVAKGRLPGIREKAESPIPVSEITAMVSDGLRIVSNDDKLNIGDLRDGVGQIVTLVVENCLQYWAGTVDSIRSIAGKVISGCESKPVVVTNGLTTPQERVFQEYLVQQGVRVVSFEHGVSAGLDQQGLAEGIGSQYTDGGDSILCYSGSSLEQYNSPSQVRPGKVVGAPVATRRIPWRRLQRWLVRKKFGIRRLDRLIVYLPLATRNNMIRGPYCQNDLGYLDTTMQVTRNVFGKIPDPCLVKLYPTNRYPDPDPFAELVEMPPNVFRTQYVDFRSLRAAADVVIVTSPMSTLGWAWSTGTPLIYLSLPERPLIPERERQFKDAVFWVDLANEDWANHLTSLLTQPNEELLEQWKSMQASRDSLARECVLGPNGDPGRSAADYVLDQTKPYNSRGLPGSLCGTGNKRRKAVATQS